MCSHDIIAVLLAGWSDYTLMVSSSTGSAAVPAIVIHVVGIKNMCCSEWCSQVFSVESVVTAQEHHRKMLGYDFNADSDGDDPWNDMFEPMVWHPAPERMQVSALLQQPCERVVGMVADASRPASCLSAPLWDSGSVDPANLLRRAVYEHNPELYVQPQRPTRRRQKGNEFSLGEILHKLQSNPEDPGLGVIHHIHPYMRTP